jgi:hypothetical protein
VGELEGNGMTRRYKSGMRWCAWRWTDVVLDGKLYLRRLHLVQTPWFSVMLHWIPSEDPQPDMHDHPVSFLSIVLRGWYDELRDDGLCDTIRWGQFKRATDVHRIVPVARNTLPLVLAGPVVRSWGYHTPEGWVPWREYDPT